MTVPNATSSNVIPSGGVLDIPIGKTNIKKKNSTEKKTEEISTKSQKEINAAASAPTKPSEKKKSVEVLSDSEVMSNPPSGSTTPTKKEKKSVFQKTKDLFKIPSKNTKLDVPQSQEKTLVIDPDKKRASLSQIKIEDIVSQEPKVESSIEPIPTNTPNPSMNSNDIPKVQTESEDDLIPAVNPIELPQNDEETHVSDHEVHTDEEVDQTNPQIDDQEPKDEAIDDTVPPTATPEITTQDEIQNTPTDTDPVKTENNPKDPVKDPGSDAPITPPVNSDKISQTKTETKKGPEEKMSWFATILYYNPISWIFRTIRSLVSSIFG